MRTNSFLKASFLGMMLMITGCSGVKFINKSLPKDELPGDYTNRTFIQGLGALRNDPSKLVGWIIIKTQTHGDDQFETVKRFLQNGLPVLKASNEPPLYSSKMTAGAKFNGSYAIASLKVGDSTAYELVISDMTYSLLEDSLIPWDAIVSFGRKLKQSDRDRCYYVLSAKLTNISYKMYNQISANASVNGGDVFGAGADVFQASSGFKNDYTVSVDLIPISHLLMTTKSGSVKMREIPRPNGTLVVIDTIAEMSPSRLQALGIQP